MISRGFASNYRIVLLAGLVLLAFGGLGGRLVFLHVGARKELLGTLEKARREVFDQAAKRGDILDTKGTILATSRSLIVLGVDPTAVRPADAKKWPQLARLAGVPLPLLERLLTTKYRATTTATPGALVVAVSPSTLPPPPPLAAAAELDTDAVVEAPDNRGRRLIRWAKISEQVTESEFAEIKQLNVAGIIGERVYRRAYPHHELAAHLIGYVDREQKPVTGLERYLNFYLRGENGWVESEKDGRRQELAQFRTREVPAADGDNVQLSIDATIQGWVEEELAAIGRKYQPLKATIIVSNPRTGFIWALGNYPTFDLEHYNQLRTDQQAAMHNVAVDAEYDPGSVFKIVAASGALNEGVITLDSRFDCALEKIDYEGVTRSLPREDVSDHFDHEHPLSIAQIISRSSNRGAVQLAMRLGDQRFYDYARAFGFGAPTGFPVGGEIHGRLWAPKEWDNYTITRMPMGQGISVTVMQMHQAMSVIASGGLLLRPQIIQEIRDRAGEVIYRYQRAEVHRAISEATARTMARLLEGVASKAGNAPMAEIPGYEVAGKTGTTQKLLPATLPSGKVVLRYSTHDHVSSFVGFFPASRPQVAISVIVDDADAHTPGKVAYGNAVAAPSFRNLALKLIPYLDIQPPAPNLPDRAVALGGGRL